MATIRDVAKKAGVSIATVSRAFNNYKDINEETCKRIFEVAEELKYSPNVAARTLVTKESRIFGYIMSGLEKGARHNMVQESLVGIYEFARSIDYEILMFAVDSAIQQNKSYLQFAEEHSLAGFVIQGIKTDDAYYKEVVKSRIPCVLIDQPADSKHVGYVSIDNYEAAREAVQYLVDRGHKNIVYVTGTDVASVSHSRCKGYLSVLRENGLIIRDDYIVRGNFSQEETHRVMLQFLPKHPEVTAIFCASDLMAIGTILAAKDLGIGIPSRLSVVGFDDILISSYTTPSLTTVHQDFYQMGYEAAKMLYDIVQGVDVHHIKKVPYKFIVRESTS